jgi:hypothetical protein
MLNMNKTLSGLVALSLLFVFSSAKSVNQFEQWKQQQQQSYQAYKDERDREFAAFLKQHWREVELMKGFVRDDRPKPVVIPVAEPEPARPVPEPVPETATAEKTMPVITTPEKPVSLKPVPVPAETHTGIRVQVDYYGVPITFYYDPALNRIRPDRISEKAISTFWSDISRTDYEPLLEQLNRQQMALQLNDWGYAVMINKLAQLIYPASDNARVLFNWFVLTKSGYKSKVAYNERDVFILIPSFQRLYDVTYFTLGGERYYAVSFDGIARIPGQVYTYDGQYPDASKSMDMVIHNQAVSDRDMQTRPLSFEYGGKRYDIEAKYSRSQIDFLETYPQLDLEVYFDSEVAETTESALLQQLATAIKNMDEQQALNFLLRFVQTSFKYKTDDMQFGEENYLFPEETIYYPYSDCEDRSVFFAWLVRRLLGLEVVGLNYPGHVATAVHMTEAPQGDAVTFDGKQFVVADPTYINARLGMTMPEYRHAVPEVIPVKKL